MTEKTEKKTDAVARPFVNMGIRQGNDGKRLFFVRVLGDDLRPIGRADMAFRWERGSPSIVGGIYHGASFSETSVVGLKAAVYKGERWQDRDEVIAWTALESAAENQIASARLAANAARTDEIREAMLPLRRAYAKLSARGDFSACHALAVAVSETLRIAPRSHEKDEP